MNLTRLAVCSWSLQPTSPAHLVEMLRALGISKVQIDLDPLRENPSVWDCMQQVLSAAGIQMVSGMFRTVGEDYSTLESIRLTGGVVPDSTWDANWRNIQATAINAQKLGLKLVTFHAGFLPHDPADPTFAKLLSRIRQIARLFAAYGIELGFETGQEDAATLDAFLKQLNEPNVGVNFDPANMLLYDKGDPVASLRALKPWLRQCHIKDATRTKTPGGWGEEVAVGEGQVDWTAFFRALDEVQFHGFCCIEREAGNQRQKDILTARQFIERI